MRKLEKQPHQVHQVAVQRLRGRRRREPIHDERDLVRLVEAAIAHAEAVVRRLAAQIAHGCWRFSSVGMTDGDAGAARPGPANYPTGACA